MSSPSGSRAEADYRAPSDLARPQRLLHRPLTPDGTFPARVSAAGTFQRLQRAGRAGPRRACSGPRPAVWSHRCASPRPRPGRFQPVEAGQPFDVVVDYAHKPGALEQVLLAARELASGRLIVVVGAGGDRDRGKRPLMGEIAARLADVALITSDNPRSEAPESDHRRDRRGHSLAVARGRRARTPIVAPRSSAPSALASPGDVVVIAGKGHEQGQEFENGRKEPFDDLGGGARGDPRSCAS